MRLIFWDTETFLIAPGQMFPRLVCLSWADPSGNSGIFDRLDAIAQFTTWVQDPEVHLIGHNVAYDMGILAAEDPSLLRPIWEAYRTRRVHCTEIRQKLLDIAAGTFRWDVDEAGKVIKNGYSLADLVKRLTGKTLQKQGTWRLRYGELANTPVALWDPDALQYALDDAGSTREVFFAQDIAARANGATVTGSIAPIPDEERQTESAWVFRLKAGWGVRTDPEPVTRLAHFLQTERDASMVHLQASGIIRANGVRDMRRIMAVVRASFEGRGEQVPLTEGGVTGEKKQPKTDEDTLRATGDPHLMILADAMGGMKLLNTYVPILRLGTRYPITSRPNALVDTGRSSWAKPNLQNPPRKGGVRECFVPRAGWVYISCDLDTIELRALAQRCLEWVGWSEMAECLRRGEDLHLALAADMLGITYAEALTRYRSGDQIVEATRQDAKMANFGFPGGMGINKFLATQGETIKKKAAADPRFDARAWGNRLKMGWMAKFREMRKYFEIISRLTAAAGPRRVVHEWSGRVRGGLDYCSAANGEFQGRTADAAKLGDRRIAWECYLGTGPLLGCRPVMFLHDEDILEAPELIAHEAAEQMTSTMIAAVGEVIPDIPITSAPVMMRRWYKGAKPVYVAGRLVPCKPDFQGGRTTWVHDTPTE